MRVCCLVFSLLFGTIFPASDAAAKPDFWISDLNEALFEAGEDYSRTEEANDVAVSMLLQCSAFQVASISLISEKILAEAEETGTIDAIEFLEGQLEALEVRELLNKAKIRKFFEEQYLPPEENELEISYWSRRFSVDSEIHSAWFGFQLDQAASYFRGLRFESLVSGEDNYYQRILTDAFACKMYAESVIEEANL